MLRPLVALAALATVLVAGPAPAVAAGEPGGRFSDDDGTPHEGWIEAVAGAGIAKGCTATTYCPGASVTRGQMATLLARAWALPAATRDHFGDDEGSPHEDGIDRVAEAGIAGGTATGRYSPDAPVTRGQMATFLARAGRLPSATRDHFTDDAGHPHEDGINRLAEAGLATGTGAGSFGPGRPVSRGQLATFLGRALGLAQDVPRPPGSETGRVSFSHPTWGASTLVTTVLAPEWGGFLHVVDAGGTVRWSRAVTEVFPGELRPHAPDADALGHLFVTFDPGRYDGVIVLRPVAGGFEDFGTLPPPGEYATRFYSARAVDLDGDGRLEVVVQLNDCHPSCAEGRVTETTYAWDGTDYAFVGPAPGAVVPGLGGTIDGQHVFAPEQEVMDHLLPRMGPPSSDDPDHRCAPSLGQPGRTVRWGTFTVYVADASSDPSEPEPDEGSYLVGWSYARAADGTDPLALRTDEGVGLGSTLTELRAAYDDGSEAEW